MLLEVVSTMRCCYLNGFRALDFVTQKRLSSEKCSESHSMVESSDIGELDIPLDHQPRTVCRDFSPPLFVAMTDENKKRCETGPRR